MPPFFTICRCVIAGEQRAPAVRMKPVHRRNDRIHLTIPWAHNVRPYGYNGTNNLQTAGVRVPRPADII